MGRCKICKKEAKLVEAHIIPKAFYKKIKGKSNTLVKLSNKKGSHPQRANKGVYDNSLSCDLCEKKYQRYDNHLTDFFIKEKYETVNKISRNKKVICKIFEYKDTELLIISILSMLFKASMSDRPEFENIDLTKEKEHQIKQVLDKGNLSDLSIDNFNILIIEKDEDIFNEIIISPTKVRINNVAYFKFNLGKYEIFIKRNHEYHSKTFQNLYVKNSNKYNFIIKRTNNHIDYKIYKEFI